MPLTDRVLAAWHQRGPVLKAVSFGAIGVINTAIDFGVFWLAAQTLGLPVILANVLSWAVAVSASYTMNSSITFARESGRKLTWRAYFTFAASGIVGLVANTATVLIALAYLPLVIANPAYQLAAAKGCAVLVSFVVNFGLSHFVVFRAPRRAPDEMR
jgi:putative flippase GtrA